MKKLLKALSLLHILSIGLFSCKTASIMKRHYNKGYYVSKKHEPADTKIKEQISTIQKPAAIDPKPTEDLAKLKGPDLKKDVVIKEEPLSENIKPKKAEKKEHRTSDIVNTFGGGNVFEGIKSAPRSLRNGLSASGQEPVRDALSLLWILILILLIVYVIGLIFDLFGLGPIFHILGVIVLVLFILWILRVI